jgi:hypothetical protein
VIESIRHAIIASASDEGKQFCNSLSEAVLGGGEVLSSGVTPTGQFWAIIQYKVES